MAAGVLAAIGWTGCQTAQGPGADALASVVITNRSPAEIRAATGKVFRAHGYRAAQTNEFKAVFERPGSTMNSVAHGSWSLERVWIRVKVSIDSLGLSRYLLRGDAYYVNDRGDFAMEEEKRIRKLQRGPYQDLLDEVRAELNVAP